MEQTRRGQSAAEILSVRDAVRRRDKKACRRCGLEEYFHLERYGKRLDVHRLSPGSLYTVEGCVLLCRDCHYLEPKRKPGEPGLANPVFVVRLPPAFRLLVETMAAEDNKTLSRVVQDALIAWRTSGSRTPASK